jgi:hypothetical protein
MSSANAIDEAVDIVRSAGRRGLMLRLFGGIAIRVHATLLPPCLERSYNDIDLVAPRRSSSKVDAFFRDRGYVGETELNALHGHYRLWFRNPGNGHRVDVFVGKFEMCHALEMGERLALDDLTVPLAELVLTKLQIVELNTKDQLDLFSLFLNHDVGATDTGEINARYIARVCAEDWGLWRTCTRNLERLRAAADQLGLSPNERSLIRARLDTAGRLIDERQKSMKWRARAAIGERLQWYELPEEPQMQG